MEIITSLTPKIKNGIVHLAILLLALFLLSFFFPITKIREVYLWQPLALYLFGVAAFYAHTFKLLPFLFRRKNLKKYLLWAIVGLLAYWLLFLGTQAWSSLELTRFEKGEIHRPIVFLERIDLLIESFMGLLILFVLVSAVSWIYYLLITDKKERKAVLSSKYTEIIINAVVLSAIFLLFIFVTSFQEKTVAIIFISFFYFNAFVFVKILFEQKKPGKYLLLVFLYFVVIVLGQGITYGRTFPSIDDIFILGILFFIMLSISLIYGYIRLKMKANEQVFSLRMGAKESELSLLKSQVNPHFLFNTLNTMYATALEEKAPKTAEGTAKLANLIRYMQNDIQKDFIPLENEITYMEDYIAIQKLRCEVPPNITTEFRNVHGKKISPGLLIPFVENAFKYGLNPTKPSELSVAVICDENSIFFECTNTYDEDFSSSYTEQGFGIGIKNTEQRLELVYPKTHSLDITKSENVFSVKLSITPKK